MGENGEIYTTGKNFTLPPAVTGGTNLTSAKLCVARRRRVVFSEWAPVPGLVLVELLD